MNSTTPTLDQPLTQGHVAYTDAEHATWHVINARLAPLHARHACRAYLRRRDELGLSVTQIPQLLDLSQTLGARCGHVVLPVAGLVDARAFLIALGRGVMPSTTWIRDGENPEYTPEPDIVHEIVGHVPLLLEPELRALLKLFGGAAEKAGDGQMVLLERLYWFTVEFGLIVESDGVRAWGAGLLSSFGELRSAFSGGARHIAFEAGIAANTPYDHTAMQPLLFVVQSLGKARDEVRRFLESDNYRRA